MSRRQRATNGMGPPLAWALTLTDLGFLLYWTIAALHAVAVVEIPEGWLYANADDRRVVAWNWSFFPLDVAFSITGLAAVRHAHKGAGIWRPLALISLILTMVAGGMAIGYWVLVAEFDLFWIGANAVLLIWPVFFLGGLVRELSAATSTLDGEAAKKRP